MQPLSFEKLRNLAIEHKLRIVGITDLTPNSEAIKELKEWQARGYAGEMSYMNRDPELLASPSKLLPEGRSLVMFTVGYDVSATPKMAPGFGRVARYAWGRDYHKVLRQRLDKLVEHVAEFAGRPIRHRVFSDAVPLMERAFAGRAGLGFTGKNTMLIRPGLGSFFFIAEILWDLPVEQPSGQLTGSCGSCRRCLDACPTGALVDEYRLDARRCISYLSIEKRGALAHWERAALGEWVFGCDVCQEVCPFNHRPLKISRPADLKELSADGGVGPLLDLSMVLNIRTEQEYSRRFGGTALMRPKRAGLLRNAACVAANTDAFSLRSNLLTASTGDSSPLVRRHGLWALAALAAKAGEHLKSTHDLVERSLTDPDPAVVLEARDILANWPA